MRERYGIDAPGVVRAFALLGAAVTVLVVVAYALLDGWLRVVVVTLLGIYMVDCWVQLGWMLHSSLAGKRRFWARELDRLGLRGDERVLEVGPGRGAVLVQVAKRLPRGRAVGVDIWRQQDQSGNGPEALLSNARIAGVEDRIDVRDGDMRALPCEDGEFDVVVASFAIHNLPAGDQARAVAEIVRVLKPGGRVVIMDFRGTAHYADVLRRSGARSVRRSRLRWQLHPPVRVVTASVG
ncbi:class I SAM-dependent methyltransferase [Fodinicola acaciae]|uniref:class I SAM-dependent methyltransferase n=1 Tax=Fodinicola acaciae TaxID=2681555 RepID=UPI0013D53998|nr:class I SAM-dependent methyltransferase [Fodinicola acaciae]